MRLWLAIAYLSTVADAVRAACIPDVPEKLLADPAVLEHPAVVAAFEEVQRNLSALFVNTTRDGLSFAIVHASSAEKAFSFNHGPLRNNETINGTADESNHVTSDSIFRVMSVSKNFAMFSALVVENLSQSSTPPFPLPQLTFETPVRLLLPEFGLPEKDWNDGGRQITLAMLASHTSGITRESYATPFNMVTATGKADIDTIGEAWAGASVEAVFEHVRKTHLMFAPGQRAGYSNAGTSILASAVAAYYNNLSNSSLTWPEITARKVFAPLKLLHSFFGPIPQSLVPNIGVPGGPQWTGLRVGLGYEPAAGMWSSANDLASYLYNAWLRPDPLLITTAQRRKSLKPNYRLPDGSQLVGAGWEVDLFTVPASDASNATQKSYASYGKAGDGGGWHSWIDVVPKLGYGIVVLSQHSGLEDYIRISPTSIRDAVHEILMSAFAEALEDRLKDRFAGWYAFGIDTGIIPEQVETNGTNNTTYAKLEVENDILYIRDLAINGTSALQDADALSWTTEVQSRFFSTPDGVVLTPSESAGENAEFGKGAQVWRMMGPNLEKCDWWDFDGYTDANGWSLSKVALVEKENTVELHYPPYDIIVTRTRSN